jgi:hypothetical protein
MTNPTGCSGYRSIGVPVIVEQDPTGFSTVGLRPDVGYYPESDRSLRCTK